MIKAFSPTFPSHMLIAAIGLLIISFLGILLGIGYTDLVFSLLASGGLLALGVGRWRTIILVIYPLTWAWTWAEIPILPGISPERSLAVPAFAGFIAELVSRRRHLKGLPFGGSVIIGILSLVLVIGLSFNPTLAGVGRLARLLQKMIWAYLIFDVLTCAKLQEVIRFGRLMLISTLIASIGGLFIVNEFGMNTRHTVILGGEWRFPSIGVIGLNLTIPIIFVALVEISITKNVFKKILYYAIFFLIITGNILTLARRETILFLPISLIVFSLFSTRAQRWRTLVILFIAVLLFFYVILPSSPVWQERFYDDLLERTTTSAEPRTALAISGWNAFLKRPLLGYGTGSASGILGAEAQDLYLDVPGSSHSSFVTMMVELGIVGLIPTVAIWISLFYGLYSASRNSINGFYLEHLTHSLFAIMTYALLRWFTADAMRENVTWTLLGYFWAIIWLAHNPLHVTDSSETTAAT